jgi:hypothetical protein
MDRSVAGRERVRSIVNRFARLSDEERRLCLELLQVLAEVPSTNPQKLQHAMSRELRVYTQDLMCALYEEEWCRPVKKLIVSIQAGNWKRTYDEDEYLGDA